MDKSFFPMMVQLLTILSLIHLHSLLVIRNPCRASEGDNVTVSCALFVPNDDEIFTSIENDFIIGDVDDFIPKYIIDSNVMYKGIDLSRFIANAPFGNSKNVNGSITLLSYNSSTDKDFIMGCHNKIRPNGASMSYHFIKTLQIRETSNKRSTLANRGCLNKMISTDNNQLKGASSNDSSGSSIMQNPPLACEGDKINISCILTVPNVGDIFTSTEISFNIDGVADAFSKCNTSKYINSKPPTGCKSINISRFMHEAPIGSGASVNGSMSFFYNSSTDKDLHIGCMNVIRSEISETSKPFIQNHTVAAAAPPSAPSLQSSVSNFNTATCSADISLSWNTPPSNRSIDRYFLYLDGSPLATTNSNSYIHSTILNINTGYQYSVTAMSCAGNSTNSSASIDPVSNVTKTTNNLPNTTETPSYFTMDTTETPSYFTMDATETPSYLTWDKRAFIIPSVMGGISVIIIIIISIICWSRRKIMMT